MSSMIGKDIIQLENKYYVSVNSSYADDRIKVLNHIETFGVFDRRGDIKLLGEELQGIYHQGTRFINDLNFRINGKRPFLLSSAIKEANEILSVDMTNPQLDNMIINGMSSHAPQGIIHIFRSKFIRNSACFEEFKFHNFGQDTFEFEVSLSFHADFKDIFEVRGMERERRGKLLGIKRLSSRKIQLGYEGLDAVQRFTEIQVNREPDRWDDENKAIFKIQLAPHREVRLEYALQFIIDGEANKLPSFPEAKRALDEELIHMNKKIAQFSTSNHQFNQWIERSCFDFISLLAKTKYGYYPYAGIPWYNTVFGRDGIITAFQTLLCAPEITHDVLLFLAKTQSTIENHFRDAEPGKIIHEIRKSEMADLNEVPFKRYYGSVDATPLFIMLAGAYYRRTADVETIKEIWPAIEAALTWIDQQGDSTNDGFIDYQHKSENGLSNQGWKDSSDSISNDDGQLAEAPIALCEVQGYVYDAKRQASYLAERLEKQPFAEKLKEEAKRLKKHFNERFWDEELQTYVIALAGPDKKPCRIRSSNAAQCLFTGIVDGDKAAALVSSLMTPDLFSGWGIRTLSSKEVRYNPMSYHNGSVWPHDNSLIVNGLVRYGFKQEALKIIEALFDAALFSDLQRLPELYCGFPKRLGEGPTSYPVACSPQAWAATAVFLCLESCLNVKIDAEKKVISFLHPRLPLDLTSMKISALKLGDGYANFHVYVNGPSVQVMAENLPQDWKMVLDA